MKNLIIRFLGKNKACLTFAMLFLFVGVQQMTAQKSSAVNLVEPDEATTLLIDEISELNAVISSNADKQNHQFNTLKQQYYTAVYEAIVQGYAVQNATLITIPIIFKDVSLSSAAGGGPASETVNTTTSITINDNPLADQAYQDLINLLEE